MKAMKRENRIPSPRRSDDGAAKADWVEPYRSTVAEVLRALDSDAETGLSTKEAEQRLRRYGRNALETEPAPPAWRRFAAQFGDVLVILLLVAALVSFGLWLYERATPLPYDALAIFTIVLLNAVMGFVQQSRAERAMAALRRLSAAEASVLRDGRRQTVAAATLVPGDIILIEAGDTVPADGRLIDSTSLQTAEAALTGESEPVTKGTQPIVQEVGVADRTNMVFSGTAATYGRGRAVVTATGMRTETGRIAGLLRSASDERTPLQHELDRLGRILGLVVLAIAAVTTVTILLVETIRSLPMLFDVLVFGVALAVAAVPEGLPAVVTAVLAIGVQRMAKRNAIIRRLAAVETLGSANVIASDKTGTLTRNEMTVRAVVTASGRVIFEGTGYAPEGGCATEDGQPVVEPLKSELLRALSVAERASNAIVLTRNGRWSVQGDPTEGALVVAARKAGLEPAALDARFGRIGEVPFSSERKLMSTVHRDAQDGARVFAFTKGAPDVLLARCTHEFVAGEPRPLSGARRAEILAENERLAGQALRTLGVAYRPVAQAERQSFDTALERDLVFLGLIGMIDPPREEARKAVARAKGAGIRPIMITGDHPKTAAVIAAEVGIAADLRALTGVEIERMSDAALERAVREVSVFARVDPVHKLRIVQALQRQGAIVAVTGDGVNDAPALKQADIGIAMGLTGTDVSKEAADMVLADDNFATIVAAVEEGRTIFANIRKFLRYLLSSNIGEVMTMFFGIVLMDVIGLSRQGEGTLVLPLLATQILWINLVTDGAPALAVGLDPADPRVMEQPPRPRDESVIPLRFWTGILLVGGAMAVSTLLVLDGCLPGGLIEGKGDTTYARTMAFTTLTMGQLYNVFNARSETHSAFDRLFENRWLLGAVMASLLLHVAVVTVPFLQLAFSTTALSLSDWLLCAAAASSVLWVRELAKAFERFRLRPAATLAGA
ncbi:MAG TPA: cation-translocating P-type ATPase [Xanthobacteraceae bacterium]|nr:cation-translocating P-type ATPase [Xanthobacteraceae bacterium]